MKTRRNVGGSRWLGERIDLGRIKAERVDRDKRIIHGVKILGLESMNRRRYDAACVRDARQLYEGKSVRCNHPKKATDPRDVECVLGWLENVQVRDDGLYADLHYMESHPMSARIVEAAERRPDLFGLSHNIQGDTDDLPDGSELVRKITEVRSVDLVADPATTDGLFEQKGKQPMKLRPFLEAIKLDSKVEKKGKKLLKRLFEESYMDAEMDMPADVEAPAEDAGPADHEQALRQGLRAAMIAAIDDESLDDKTLMSKLKEILAARTKLLAKSEPVEEEEDEDIEEEDASGSCDEDDKMKKESRELKLLRKEKRGRELCEEAGIPADSVLLESLARLPDDAAMKRLIEREKGKKPGSSPRSGSGSGGSSNRTEGKKGKASGHDEDSVEDFMASLRN